MTASSFLSATSGAPTVVVLLALVLSTALVAVIRRVVRGGVRAALALLARAREARGEAGMTTAEYAVGTVAAVAFAVVLYKIVRSDAVSTALASVINHALHAI